MKKCNDMAILEDMSLIPNNFSPNYFFFKMRPQSFTFILLVSQKMIVIPTAYRKRGHDALGYASQNEDIAAIIRLKSYEKFYKYMKYPFPKAYDSTNQKIEEKSKHSKN